MIRVVFTSKQIVTVVPNTPEAGITYTTLNVIVCSKEEALDFFKDYPQEELDKIIETIHSPL